MFFVGATSKDVLSDRIFKGLFGLGKGACGVLNLFPFDAVWGSPLDCSSTTESCSLRVFLCLLRKDWLVLRCNLQGSALLSWVLTFSFLGKGSGMIRSPLL